MYRVPRTAAEILHESEFIPQCIHKVMNPRRFLTYEVSIWSDIGRFISHIGEPLSSGNRRTQEDRCTFCFELIEGRSDTGFFGVFDGTVGK